jgi:hypothetical protein
MADPILANIDTFAYCNLGGGVGIGKRDIADKTNAGAA